MTDINYKPIFEYLDEVKNELKSDIQDVRQDVRSLQTSMDNLAKMVKDFHDEHIVMHRRLEILEAWAKQVAAKLGISLPN